MAKPTGTSALSNLLAMGRRAAAAAAAACTPDHEFYCAINRSRQLAGWAVNVETVDKQVGACGDRPHDARRADLVVATPVEVPATDCDRCADPPAGTPTLPLGAL